MQDCVEHGGHAARPDRGRPPAVPVRDRAQRQLAEELELVGQARTGREAIAAALETRPDLAVLDVEMPDLDGLEVLQAFNREGLSTRVLFVSGQPGRAESYDLIEAGAAGVLEKDAMPDQIGDALDPDLPGRDGAGAVGAGRR